MRRKYLSQEQKNEYLKIAHELGYPEETIKRIKRSRTRTEAERALTAARHDQMRRDEKLYGYNYIAGRDKYFGKKTG